MIICHAHIKVQPEHRETFLEQVQEVIAGSQAEAGNISYQLYEDTQQVNHFVMVEEWKDQEATEFHRGTDHFKRFIQNAKDLLSEPLRVKRYEAFEKQQ